MKLSQTQKTLIAAYLNRFGYEYEDAVEGFTVNRPGGWIKNPLLISSVNLRDFEENKAIIIKGYGMPVFNEGLRDFIFELIEMEEDVDLTFRSDQPQALLCWF